MTQDLKPLLDRAAIRGVIERYCRGIDRLDAELVNSVYWDDATDDHGVYKGPGPDFAAFVIPILRDTLRSTMHVLGQSLIELDGTRARCETYYVSYHCGEDQGRDYIETSAGRYVDVFEERKHEWRILDRVVVVEWTRIERNVEEASVPRAMFTQGRRDRSDLAYACGAAERVSR